MTMEMVHLSKQRVVYLLVFVVSLSLCYADKAPVKTIKSADGDIVDCIHISKQPALDHPSLKGHPIQRSPSSHPQVSIDKKKGSNNGRVKQIWHMNGVCPEETIPIRRTSSAESFVKKERRPRAFPAPSKSDQKPEVNLQNHEYAVAYVNGDTYYGGQATINLWNPKVEKYGEFSLSQIWILGGGNYESLEAGWQVSQQIYGDNNTRLFIYSTQDGYATTGCYNLQCPAFVQTDNTIVLGGTISPVSSYEGSLYEITILIWKDPQGGNWWLKIGDTTVGYWPSTLFTILNKSSDLVEWGGEIVNLATSGQHTTTEMGSGHFPSEGLEKSSYFKNVQFVGGSNNLLPVSNFKSIVTNSHCYNISFGDEKDPSWGSNFFYGGPGGNDAACT